MAVLAGAGLVPLLMVQPAFAVTVDDQTVPVAGHSNTESPGGVSGAYLSGVATTDGSATSSVSVNTAEFRTYDAAGNFTASSLSGQGGSASVSNLGLTAAQVNDTSGTGTSYDCVKQTTSSSKLVAYTPVHADLSNSTWEVHYIDHFYSMSNARYVSGAWTTQFEQCVLGGARNKSFTKRMARTDGEVSIYDGSANRNIGYKWGTAVSSGSVSSAIDFSVSATKSTKISGSIPVSNGGSETGGVGSGLCGRVGPVSGNQVNAAWNYTYPGYGTNDFKGNVGHALYEYPVANKTSFSYYFQACYQPRY